MAIDNFKFETSGRAGGFSDPKTVYVHATFVGGQETITASEIGLSSITFFEGCSWGQATGVGAYIFSTTTYVEGGVTSLALEQVDEAGALLAGDVVLKISGR